MSHSDESSITEAVLERISHAPDDRIRQVSLALVRHLHAFLREIEPTESEWSAGIKFLTEVGHKCSDVRQEFILLSDVLGVSMLVDAMNHRTPSTATETTVLGPFYRPSQHFQNGQDIRGDMEGAPLYIEGSVNDTGGTPIVGAEVEIWHADADGYYDLQKKDGATRAEGRGRFLTDASGHFSLWTVCPASYPIPDDGPVGRMLAAQGRHPFRPAHVHFKLTAPHHNTVVTHLFVEGDEYLESDVVFGVKASLISSFERQDSGLAPDGRTMNGEWFHLRHNFVLAPCDRNG